MNISSFVKELAKILPKNLLSMQTDDRRAVASRVIFSGDWEKQEQTTLLSNDPVVIDGLYEKKSLRLCGHFGRKRETTEILNFISALLFESKQMIFGPLDFKAKVTVWWKKVEDFFQETDMADLSAINVKAVFYSEDPTRPRFGLTQKEHRFEAQLSRLPLGMKKLVVTAQGDYAPILQKKAEGSVTISLSPADTERLLKASGGMSRKLLEAALKPQKKRVCRFNSESGMMEEGWIEEITLLISASRLPYYEGVLGRKLPVNSQVGNKRSSIARITRIFWRTSTALSAMKELIGQLDCLETTTVFDRPIITLAGAKAFLDQLMAAIEETCVSGRMFYGVANRQLRLFALKQAEEQFGKDVVTKREDMEERQYVEFLEELGFIKGVQAEEGSLDFNFKEKNLFLFLLQSYRANPEKLVARYRELYVNKPPKTLIWGEAVLDASKLKRLQLPSQAKVSGLSLRRISGTGESEELIVQNELPFKEDDFSFWARIPIEPEGAPLLELQNYACEALGITVANATDA